ncbi:hypothetical protein C8R47DRAFT_1106616 [Mycena vitilis]|nr:hypothetical protein C8R47DRAFT_1106616 [Mycena vitilis]
MSSKPLTSDEQRWQQLYDELLSQGFQLRARYSTESTLPPPKRRRGPPGHKDRFALKDGNMNDASHATHGDVVLKFADSAEKEMLELLHSFPGADEHVFPLLSSLPGGPKGNILVMPFFGRLGSVPYFATSRDLVSALLQVARGLAFMHSHNIAHGAVRFESFVEDRSDLVLGGLHFVANGFSPDLAKRIRLVDGGRSAVQPKCFIINFGSAKVVSPGAVELSDDIEGLLRAIGPLLQAYPDQLPSLASLHWKTGTMTATDVVKVLEAEVDKESRMLVYGYEALPLTRYIL